MLELILKHADELTINGLCEKKQSFTGFYTITAERQKLCVDINAKIHERPSQMKSKGGYLEPFRSDSNWHRDRFMYRNSFFNITKFHVMKTNYIATHVHT